jgi:hypothetical protein
MLSLRICIILLFSSTQLVAQPAEPTVDSAFASLTASPNKDHLNFFVISKRKKGKLDLATRFNVFRTKIRGIFHPNTFISVIAENVNDAVSKIKRNLDGNNASLGTIWFDSHGGYKKGYSLFYVGHDECNTKTLSDSMITCRLSLLSSYSNRSTRVIIGSCYGGATYERPSVDYTRTFKMDGDSLMRSLGKIFHDATIFGSESWVMSKPGLFNRKPAVGGNPGRKLFRDVCYRPAWENIGVWNEFNASTQTFCRTNTIALDGQGNLVIRDKPYFIEKNIEKDIQKHLRKLQPGLYR